MLQANRYFMMTVIMFLMGSFVLTVKGQKCSYDTKGVQEVPADWAVVTYDGGAVRNLKGIVTNSNGDPMAHITLALFKIAPDQENGEGFVGSTSSDEKGWYCFGSLPRGRYRLLAGTRGFQRTEIDLKMVSSGSTAGKSKLNIALELAY
jgi:hypothetical protein